MNFPPGALDLSDPAQVDYLDSISLEDWAKKKIGIGVRVPGPSSGRPPLPPDPGPGAGMLLFVVTSGP